MSRSGWIVAYPVTVPMQTTFLISSLMGIFNPVFFRIFLDRLLTGKNPDWFMPFILALGGMGIIQIVVAWMHVVYSLRINGKLAVVGNTSYMWKILRMPMEFFTQRMAGDIQQRQSANASIARELVDTFAPLALNTIMMVIYLVVMLRYSLVLTLVGMIMAFQGFLSSFTRPATELITAARDAHLHEDIMQREGGATGESLLKGMNYRYATYSTQREALQSVREKKSDLTERANVILQTAYENGTMLRLAGKYNIEEALKQ